MAGRVRAASNHPGLAIPKGPRVGYLKRQQRNAQNKQTREVRMAVFARDETCRVPWCEGWQIDLEMAHLDAKGMGGDHGLRTTTENCVLLCRLHHQGPRSHHSGHIKVRALTDKGADGPLCFEFYEKLPSEC